MIQLSHILKSLFETLHLGWVIIAAIALCSVAALAIFLERAWHLRRTKVFPRNFLIQLQDLLQRHKYAEAQTLCRQDESPLAHLILGGLNYLFGDSDSESTKNKAVLPEAKRSQLKEKLEELGRREAHRLEGSSETLNTIAGVAPLLGLLGTVIGMVEIFSVIATDGLGNANLLSGGIGTALINTVFGLMVAIPAFLGYKFCRTRIRALILDLESYTRSYLELITEDVFGAKS